MLSEKQKELIFKHALQNAVLYKGKANTGAVLGKVLSSEPVLKKSIKDLQEEVSRCVNEINLLTPQEQKEELRKAAPKLLEKEVKKEDLPELTGAQKGRVVTRFAPAPTGALSLPHLLRAVMLSYLYAKKYKGRFILRFEDTDPNKIKKEYYEWIKEDLKNAGVKWDRLVFESDYMNQYYKYAEQLIKEGKVYMCFCSADEFRKLKLAKTLCRCRNASIEENIQNWKKTLQGHYKEGEVVVRLKTSMQEPNPVLRDPPLLRISKTEHPLKGKRFSVWPLYNFACAITDNFSGITHVFRGKEHEHNTAVQERIYKALGWKTPITINFGMVYLPGEKLHKRDINKLIESGEIKGWDDPKLPTVRALLKRGFHPKAFEECARQCGLSKTDIIMGWENIEGINRKIIDPMANRYMVVTEPKKITINGLKAKKIKLNLHPDFPERGKRVITANPKGVYVSGEDFEKLSGRVIRLIGLGNVRLGEVSEYVNDEIVKDMQKIQWVSKPNVLVKIIKPDSELFGLGEPNILKLKSGNIIQMERIGFCRVNKVDRIRKENIVYFAHK